MSAISMERRTDTLAEALLRVQVRFATFHQHNIWNHIDPDVYSRGRRLMVWISDRCNIPAFEDILLTPELRSRIEAFPMRDYAEAVTYGEGLMRDFETVAGYGQRNEAVYRLGVMDGQQGRDYRQEYIPDIDVKQQSIRYPEGGFEYYQGYRYGHQKLTAASGRMRDSRNTSYTRSGRG